MLYPPKPFEYPSVRPSVCLSLLRFRTLNLSSFWAIFFKLCVDIDIGEEWFQIINGLNSFINNRVMTLDWCKKSVFPQYLQNKWTWWILIKFHICINIYKIHVVSNARYFWSIVNRVMALDRRQNCVYAQYLVNWFVDFDQILYVHCYWQALDLDDWTIFFIHFQQSYGPWLMPKFYLCSMSCGPIDGFW